MPWIKYNGKDTKTYPKNSGRYKIRRYDEEGYATFNVGWGWAHLITMPGFYWVKDEIDNHRIHSDRQQTTAGVR